ncbi:winged-helix domain-containing protein [Streptomyces sp. NBC_00988]|uniref:winged helix-turn-helix transcriptional regulator n=1 Tax=Streptomyces sp. NBC_00988 TaxID=2903704 RepID=UPI003864F90F
MSPPPPTPALPPPHQATGVLLLTDSHQPLPRALPALDLLHPVQVIPHTGQAPGDLPAAYAILIDGRRNLPQVRNLCQTLYSADPDCPLVLVVTEGGLAAVTADWGIDAMLLDTAGPAEVEARLRLAAGHHQHTTLTRSPTVPLHHGVLSMDAATYTARRRGRALDLTMKEFELLKYLAQHPGRVFDRAQLLREIWGEDYAGGTRTLDVHVRRLRAKLGVEDAGLLVTVRGVGYRFAPTRHRRQQEHGQRPQAKPVPPATAAAAPAEASALLDSTACLTRGSG